MHLRPTARTQWGDQLQVFMDIVPVALRGSTGLYVRRDPGDPVGSLLNGSRVQETGCGTTELLRVLARLLDSN